MRSSGSKIWRSFGGLIGCRSRCIERAWSFRGSSSLPWRIKCAGHPKSICANLAEGFAKQSYSAAEYRRYLTVAIGSSDEMQLWLRYCVDLGYIEEVTGRQWVADYVEISKMLQGLYASWSRSS